uniref:Even-skipped homeobox 2 n=1 Tax=Accipiter nisus TaxID=211598 RepID=A0A8B9NF03_9AVES
MMTHAAATGSLPYPFHSHVPLHYYPHVGVTAAAAAAAASGAAAAPFATSIRPLDTFRALSHPYSRPELLCSFRHPGLYQAPAAAAAGLNSSAATAAAAAAAASALGSRGAAAADFPCTAAGQRSESGFLPYSAAVLSKAAVASPDQREEAPLTR